MRLLCILLALLVCFVGSAEARERHHQHRSAKAQPLKVAAFNPGINGFKPTSGGGGGTTFTPTALRYMATSGCNDANAGTSPASPWCSPNHAMNCGDVIIAAAGNYGALQSWGTVSNCPSSTAGIDGIGLIYAAVVLCAGPDLESCKINDSGTTGVGAVNIANNNWAILGFKVTAPSGDGCFAADATASGTTIIHDVSFINDIAFNCQTGFYTADGAKNHNIPGNGVDYWSVVGSIAQNANQNPICVAAIDAVGVTNSDTVAGTHIFFYNNFSYANLVNCFIDGEGMMFDTPDAHGFQSQMVALNNMIWHNERFGFNLFYQTLNTGTATIIVNNNTLYGNNVHDLSSDTGPVALGDVNTNAANGTTIPYNVTVQNNISQTAFATSGCSTCYIFAMNNGVGPGAGTWTIGGSGNQNIYLGSAPNCATGTGGTCDTTDSVITFNSGSFGTNTYTSPSFTNVSDLLTNWVGAPNCTGFQSVTQCMGYNPLTSTLTTLTPISDLTPTAGGMTGKGFQLPSSSCGAVSTYPSHLKGLVRLQWNSGSSTITQVNDLATHPCGL